MSRVVAVLSWIGLAIVNSGIVFLLVGLWLYDRLTAGRDA